MGADAFNVVNFDWAGAFDLAVVTTLTALGKGLLARQAGRDTVKPSPSTLPDPTYRQAVTRHTR
jgi:hypothetical protein